MAKNGSLVVKQQLEAFKLVDRQHNCRALKPIQAYNISMINISVQNKYSNVQNICNMKMKSFKIRPTLHNSHQDTPKRQTSHQGICTDNNRNHYDDSSHLQEFFRNFQKYIQRQQLKEEQYYSSTEARDRRIIVQPPRLIDDGIDVKSLKKWTTQVFKKVFSTAFNYFSKNQITFEQAKIFCSENIFKNLVGLNQSYSLSPSEFEMIDSHLKQGVLDYLGLRYPLTDSSQINKRLQEMVHPVDNIESLSNNFMVSTNVAFEFREDGNYNDLIMQFINEIKGTLDQKSHRKRTNYRDFEDFMTTLFEKVTDNEWMGKNQFTQTKNTMLKTNLEASKSSRSDDRKSVQELQENLRKKMEEKEQYKARVKEYTHYLIGRKLPQDLPQFTEKEIQSRILNIKSPKILRILTKWCEQLWKKYTEVAYFRNRSESVKVQKGGNVNSLLLWMREKLDRRLEAQKEEILLFIQQLSENNYQMQSDIMKQELSSQQGSELIEEAERISGKFASKIVKNIHSYIVIYLNKLIHGLMTVSQQLFEENNLSAYHIWPSPPNLLSFSIGDIMRCKFSSKEKEVVSVLRQMQRISQQNPQKFKIVRVKNRLKSGTNDILINAKFNNAILCEVQLAIKSNPSNFIKCSNLFHHYIYELQRSTFGPLSELCSIWNNLDRRTALYDKLIEDQYSKLQGKQHICQKLNKESIFEEIRKPFICSSCNIPQFQNNYPKSHSRCQLCGYYLCSNCYIERQNPEKLKVQFIQDEDLRSRVVKVVSKQQPIPEYGICIYLESKLPTTQIFRHIIFERNKKSYLFSKRQDGSIYQVQDIKTPRLQKQFRKKNLIFELDKNYNNRGIISEEQINRYMLVVMVRDSFQKQRQSISLQGEKLNTNACRQMLAYGTQAQRDKVTSLFLADNRLKKLPFDPQDFPNLNWLTLSRNVFSSFQNFEGMDSLKTLTWKSGQLKAIPKKIFEIVSLQKLSLSNNSILQLTPLIAQLQNLRILELGKNNLTALPSEIGECRCLVQIGLSQNKLKEIPLSLFSLQKLEILNLQSNKLEKLPEEVSQLTQLRQLNISNNKIEELKLKFQALKFLQSFDCSNNKIGSLPEDIIKCERLKELLFDNTEIRVLPENIHLLSRVEKLSLPTNEKQLPQLKQLQTLSIKNCQISDFPNLYSFQSLRYLDLSNNKLKDIQKDSISSSNRLSKLCLSRNQLQFCPFLGIFRHLKTVDLSYNKIATITEQSLKDNLGLDYILLNNNLLISLPFVFTKLTRLKHLILNNNSLTALVDRQYEKDIDLQKPIWPHLTLINLNHNRIRDIPRYLCNLPRLIDLFLANNQLALLPAEITLLIQLQQIQVQNNHLSQLPESLLLLPNLRGLRFSGNKITRVPEFIARMPKLEAFEVNNCPIEVVECEEWVSSKKDTIWLAGLPSMIKKMKQKRSALQQSNSKSQLQNSNIENDGIEQAASEKKEI